jgi:methyltransferase (TIGR00027 family)
MIHTSIEGVARTLFLTLRARADEQQQPTPLFDDPWSVDWYQYTPQYNDYDQWYNPIFQLASAIRTQLTDEAIARFVAQRERVLVVELGAGLSTRYYRIAKQQKCHWVQMDLPDAIAVRRKFDVEDTHHQFIDASLIAPNDWLGRLPQGYAPEDVVFILEGVAMFLQPEEMTNLLTALRHDYAGASFVIDVVRQRERDRLNQSFMQMDSPVHWGASKDELASLGMDVRYTQYILLQAPERWRALGIDDDKRTEDRSGFIAETVLLPL